MIYTAKLLHSRYLRLHFNHFLTCRLMIQIYLSILNIKYVSVRLPVNTSIEKSLGTLMAARKPDDLVSPRSEWMVNPNKYPLWPSTWFHSPTFPFGQIWRRDTRDWDQFIWRNENCHAWHTMTLEGVISLMSGNFSRYF